MIPLMGFCQLALFGGYAIYFPELFPTRLRSSGSSRCLPAAGLAARLSRQSTAAGSMAKRLTPSATTPCRAGWSNCEKSWGGEFRERAGGVSPLFEKNNRGVDTPRSPHHLL